MILGIDANIQHALMCARKDIERRKNWMEMDYLYLKSVEKEYGISAEYLNGVSGIIQGLQWALESVDDIRQSKSYRNR